MIYIRVACIAVLRYRLEAPFRQMLLADGMPMKKLKRMHFGHVLIEIKRRKLVNRTEANRINRQYNKYSRLLHGYRT